MNPSEIKLRKLEDEYVVHKNNAIGEGAYGQVFKAERRGQPGQTFAVKVMHPQGEGGTYKLVTSNASLREIKLLRELTHPNIVTLRDQFVNLNDMSLALVYDYAKTDLRVMIWDHKRMKKSMPERVIRAFMFQLLQGVKYLHENWILHRDLKPANILVEKQLTECHAGTAKADFALGVPWLKICDFGLARIFQAPVKALSEVERVVATLWYRAPELLLGSRHYTTAVDVWAVGCIFAEMYNRQPLFPGSEVAGKGAPFQEAQCKTIFKVLGVPKESRWPGVSHMPSYKHIAAWGAGYPSESILRKTVPSMKDPHALNLLARLLELDPAKRISADEALQHEFFRPIRDMEVSAVQARQQPRGAALLRPKKRPRNTLSAVLAEAAARTSGSGAGAGAGAGAGGGMGTAAGAPRNGAGAHGHMHGLSHSHGAAPGSSALGGLGAPRRPGGHDARGVVHGSGSILGGGRAPGS